MSLKAGKQEVLSCIRSFSVGSSGGQSLGLNISSTWSIQTKPALISAITALDIWNDWEYLHLFNPKLSLTER